MTIFQDGHKIIAVNRVQTQYRSNQYAPRHWSINNYSARLRPSAGTIYVDDARIEAG